MPDILQRALDPCVAPGGILFSHPDNEMLDLLEHAPTTRPANVCPLPRDQLSVPPENRVGCDDRRDLTEPATAHPASMHGEPTAFFTCEADPGTEARAEDAVFLNQIRDGRLPLVGPPAGHGYHEESNRSDIHDGGSLPHPLNVELGTASAEKWDTTGPIGGMLRAAQPGTRGGGSVS